MNRPSAQEVFRDYVTDDEPGSGPWSPDKSDIRDLFASRGQLPSDFGALGDTTDVPDFAITTGFTVLSSPGGFLENAVNGQNVCVGGAGDTGAPLYTTVTDASNAPTSVIVADAAETTVAGAAGNYGTDDTDALIAWGAADGPLRCDPTAIYTISAPIALPEIAIGKLRLRMTGDIAAGVYGAAAGGSDIGAPQVLSAVSAGATSFTPPDATLFTAGDLFLAASNQIIGIGSYAQLGETGIVQSVNGDGSITTAEPLKFSYGNFRVASFKFGSTPGAAYAGGDFLSLVGGTFAPQLVPSISTANDTITVGVGAPMGGLLDHFTGAAIQVRSSGALPTGIAAATNYYCGNVVLGSGKFSCQLFTVQADALAGEGASLVNITSVGSGTITIVMPLQIRVKAVSATGAILDWYPITWGAYTAVPTVPATFTTTGAGANAEAQTIALEACTVTPIGPITPDLDVEIIGDGYTDHRGLLVTNAKGGRVRASGANCGRLFEIASSQDTLCEIGNASGIQGDVYSSAVAITGASKRITLHGVGEQHANLRSVAINPVGAAQALGIVQDAVVRGLHVTTTATVAAAAVAVSAVDAATGANLITIAAVLNPGDAVTIAAAAGGTLPTGLSANEVVYAGNVSRFNGSTSFQPYTDYDDAVNGLGVNVIALTSAGTGTLTAAITEGGTAISTSDAQIGAAFEDCTIVSCAADGLASAGGNLRLSNCSFRSAIANGVRLTNSGFYPAVWKLDEVSAQGAGLNGIRINGGAYVRDRLQLGRLTTRGNGAAGVRAIAGASTSIILEHAGSLRSDHDAAESSLGCVIFSGIEGPALPELSIEGVPAAGVGLRVAGCKGTRSNPARINAGGVGAKLVLVEKSTMHALFDQFDLYDAGFATVTGVDVSDTTITDITVGNNIDFHSCATPVVAGASSIANRVSVLVEKTIYANHAGSPYTAPNGRVKYMTDSTAGTITINPPAHPSLTDAVTVKDDAGTAQTNAVTFGGTVGANDNAVINRQGDFTRYEYSSNQARWSQTL